MPAVCPQIHYEYVFARDAQRCGAAFRCSRGRTCPSSSPGAAGAPAVDRGRYAGAGAYYPYGWRLFDRIRPDAGSRQCDGGHCCGLAVLDPAAPAAGRVADRAAGCAQATSRWRLPGSLIVACSAGLAVFAVINHAASGRACGHANGSQCTADVVQQRLAERDDGSGTAAAAWALLRDAEQRYGGGCDGRKLWGWPVA